MVNYIRALVSEEENAWNSKMEVARKVARPMFESQVRDATFFFAKQVPTSKSIWTWRDDAISKSMRYALRL